MDDNPFEDLQPPSDEYMERQYGADRAKWKANGAVPPDDREPSDLPPEEANERPGHTGSDHASQAGNHAGAEWPHPIDFLDEPNSPPPELTYKHAPDALWDFCIDTSERMGVDPTSLLIGGLVSCAAVTSDAWRLQPKRYDYTWTESPRLWAAILGDPGVLKSPIIAACTAPIDQLEVEARKRHQNEMVVHNRELADWKKGEKDTDAPARPKMLRYMVEGATIEAIQEVLRDDEEAKFDAPAGKVLCRHDEMSEFFANLDRYNAGGKGGGDRGAYLRLYNGGRYTVDRIARGPFATENWSAGFLGGIQPGPIQRIAKNSAEDGMLQRFIYCVPGLPRQGLDRRPSAPALKRYATLFPALAALLPRAPEREGERHQHVVFQDGAHQHREAIDALARAMASLPDTSPRLQAALAKWPGLYARLCLVFHLIEVADSRVNNLLGPPVMVVQEQTARRVADFMQEILLPHLLRADTLMFSSVQAVHARWIAGHILASKYERITSRDVTRAYQALRAPECKDELANVMASLVTVGWLEPETPKNPMKPVHAWIVNPGIHVIFAGRAAREDAARKKARDELAETFEALRRKREDADGR